MLAVMQITSHPRELIIYIEEVGSRFLFSITRDNGQSSDELLHASKPNSFSSKEEAIGGITEVLKLAINKRGDVMCGGILSDDHIGRISTSLRNGGNVVKTAEVLV